MPLLPAAGQACVGDMGGPTEFRQRLESEAEAYATATYDTDTAALQVAVYTRHTCLLAVEYASQLT